MAMLDSIKCDVSIIIPVFNTGAIMQETIDSIIEQQDYQGTPVPSYEIILIDDASTDKETIELLNQFKSIGEPYRVIDNQQKKGVSGARNTGILAAKGDWITFLDSDDLMSPKALAMKYARAQSSAEVKWIATPFYRFEQQDKPQEEDFATSSPILYAEIKKDFDNQQVAVIEQPVKVLAKICCIQTSTVFVCRQTLAQAGLFNESLKRAEDYELWLRLGLLCRLDYLPEKTAGYRIRVGSLSHSDEPTFFYDETMLLGLIKQNEFSQYRHLLKARLLIVLQDHSIYFKKADNLSSALYWSLQLIKQAPFKVKSWRNLISILL